MSEGARSRAFLFGLFSLFLAACTKTESSGGKPPAGAQAAIFEEAPSSEERCLIRLNAERDVTEVYSERDGYGLLLPGTQWALRCEDDVPLIGSAGLLRMSVRHGAPGPESLESRLRDIHHRFSSSLAEMGLVATPPEFAVVGAEDKALEKLVMTYEVHGGDMDASQTKSVHAWSAIRTYDGRVLEYHVSWTGSQGAWQEGMLRALRKMLLPFVPLSSGA